MSEANNITYSHHDASFLTDKINEEFTKYGNAYPFSFCLKDKDNQILAGCSGSIIYGAIYTDQLWVHPDYRKKGLGFELMSKVHDFGIKNNCKIATVCTMSFQDSIKFYQKVGYEIDFERNGYIKNSKCIFLKRFL